MTARKDCTVIRSWVAIDIAKKWNVVAIEAVGSARQRFKIANTRQDHDKLLDYLRGTPQPCRVAFEPTGNYHRPLAYRLVCEGFEVCMVSSLAAARYREVTYNSWDKNDPKDADVILDLLKQGKIQRYCDPLVLGNHDLQELSKTYMQLSLARTRLGHSLMTHYLPLYWPEIQRYWHSSRTGWITDFLLAFPLPATVTNLSREAFVKKAWSLVGRKVNKRVWLEELHHYAHQSIGLPVHSDSLAVQTFRLQLKRFREITEMRADLEQMAEAAMAGNQDHALLRSIPGIGPVLALTILAEAGDMRRFKHHRQFLKYCGLDLAKSQSGSSRGKEKLSKRGNARLRYAFWFAGTVAIRMRENSFREKYERYMSVDPGCRDRRRKAYTAIAAKMARVVYGIVKSGVPYRSYHEQALPSGMISIRRAVEAIRTS
jgi:transposase